MTVDISNARLQSVINKISDEFIAEAVNSPNLLEDMASMEKYMSESYNGRIFVELLQNADDCGSSEILLTQNGNDLIFANNGRCFDKNDVVAISRSGASSKKRGLTIGYRGIGFKSTTYLSRDIVIYSDGTFFTFSKSICAKALGKSEEKIPTVRIPFLANDLPIELNSYVNLLVAKGFTTVFIFRNAKIDSFKEEVNEISYGYFLFLRNIAQCSIDVDGIVKSFAIDRTNDQLHTLVKVRGRQIDEWLLLNNGDISLAFKHKDGRIVSCSSEEALYHCYLPTYDKMAYPFKVNGDFSTDPSRKHLTNDKMTSKALESIADTLFAFLKIVFSSDNRVAYSSLFEILMQTTSFSYANSSLKERFKAKITSSKWIALNSGVKISPKDYKLLPNWLEESEKMFIRQKSKYIHQLSLDIGMYKDLIGVENFLAQFSNETFSNEDLIIMMEDTDFVSSVNDKTNGKILAHIIKAGKSAQYISGQSYEYERIAINTTAGVKTIGEVAKTKTSEMTDDVKEAISQNASSEDVAWFSKKEAIPLKSIQATPLKKSELKTTIISSDSLRPSVSRWRSAEQQCVEMEKHLGNTAVDVSKQNMGYDIESTTPTGEKRHIEVKLLSGNSKAFSMTNNEYTAAHQYGNAYYLCLITQSDMEAKMLYICNPLVNLSFEKRIRQWEWYCEQYSGVEYTIDMK